MAKSLNLVPQRFVFGAMGMLALANAFAVRSLLSVTITQLVRVERGAAQHAASAGESCPVDSADNTTYGQKFEIATHSEKDQIRYEWSESTQGLLLSAFYYGFVVTHVPGALLAERFGGRWAVAAGMLMTCAGTALTPLALLAGGASGLFIARVVVGLGQGPVTPAVSLLMARWVPPAERSRFGAVVFGGAQFGNLFSRYFSGLLLADGGKWQNVFYVFALICFVWLILWIFLCYNTPNDHPFISASERDFLNKHVAGSALKRKLDPTPWNALLRSAPLWVTVIGAFGCDWAMITISTDLPKYMSDVLQFNIKDTGLMSALPYIAIYVAIFVFAALCDAGINRKWHSIGNGRKIYNTICTWGPAICILLASYSGCNRFMAVSFFVLAMATMGGFYSSIKVNPMDISPNYAGTATAIVNGMGGVAGIIAPYLFGLLTPDHTLSQWRSAFFVVGAVLVCSNIAFWIWGSGEQQWWDDVDQFGYPKIWSRGPLPRRTAEIGEERYKKTDSDETKNKLSSKV